MCVVQSGQGLMKRCACCVVVEVEWCVVGSVVGGDVECWLYNGGEVMSAGERGGALW